MGTSILVGQRTPESAIAGAPPPPGPDLHGCRDVREEGGLNLTCREALARGAECGTDLDWADGRGVGRGVAGTRSGAAAWGVQCVRSERGCIRSGGDAEPLRLGRMGGLHPRRRQAVPGPGQLPPGHHGTRRFGNTPRSSPDDLRRRAHLLRPGCRGQPCVSPSGRRPVPGRSPHAAYSHCRFFLLSSDHESTPAGKRNHAFYRSLGFLSYEEKEMAGFGLPRNRPDLRNAAP